ncbi:hypothetical protein [Candidatus Albibeggiatoa sp. nov. NOAA]|uniref:dioxygenase family protein n=1 Tax=Candidatus Albibeggiatoa sp. nov. NOAA TaxID=3162724 RepID=UPI0032F5F570|nr:hypothetical protein [Thiotrichaceae bacterium]
MSHLHRPTNQSRRFTLKAIAALPFCSYGLTELMKPAYAEDVACTFPPSMAKGPYWVDEELNRVDVTTNTDRASVLNGLPLTLNFTVLRIDGSSCSSNPIPNLQIDIWHADAAGEYSDVIGSGQSDTRGQNFLRGYQLTNVDGKVSFQTIFPGWYPSRTAHIHLRARAYDENGRNIYDFATQLFFDDVLTDRVYENEPYNTRGIRDTRNSNDFGFLRERNPSILNIVTNDDGSMTSDMVMGFPNVPENIADNVSFDVSAVNNGDAIIPSIESVLTIKPADVGTTGNIYVLAFLNGSWFINNGQVWLAYADSASTEIAAFYTGQLESAHNLTILSGLDISNLKGTRLYVGYGVDADDMLQKSQYKIAYTL